MHKRKYRVALIGCGCIGAAHMDDIHDKTDITVECVCDTNEQRARDFYAKYHACRYETDWKRVVSSESVDIVIIATYPDSVAKIVKQNSDKFKKGAVITDICGVKSRISKEICSAVPDGVFYVGSHPMAGKEVEGFDNAEPTLFDGCGFIIVPTEKSDDKSIELVSSMARHLGAARLAVNTPEEHDSIIAYTSDLMHISASALCLNFNENMNLAYTAGAFRDCTRIAMINPKLWTELFLENAEHIVTEIDRFSASLNKFRDAIANGRADRLFDILSTVRANKTDILKR